MQWVMKSAEILLQDAGIEQRNPNNREAIFQASFESIPVIGHTLTSLTRDVFDPSNSAKEIAEIRTYIARTVTSSLVQEAIISDTVRAVKTATSDRSIPFSYQKRLTSENVGAFMNRTKLNVQDAAESLTNLIQDLFSDGSIGTLFDGVKGRNSSIDRASTEYTSFLLSGAGGVLTRKITRPQTSNQGNTSRIARGDSDTFTQKIYAVVEGAEAHPENPMQEARQMEKAVEELSYAVYKKLFTRNDRHPNPSFVINRIAAEYGQKKTGVDVTSMGKTPKSSEDRSRRKKQVAATAFGIATVVLTACTGVVSSVTPEAPITGPIGTIPPTLTLEPTMTPVLFESGLPIQPVDLLAISGLPAEFSLAGAVSTPIAVDQAMLSMFQREGFTPIIANGNMSTIERAGDSAVCVMSMQDRLFNPDLNPPQEALQEYRDAVAVYGVNNEELTHVIAAVPLSGYPENIVCALARANQDNPDFKSGTLRAFLIDRNTDTVVGHMQGGFAPEDMIMLAWTDFGPIVTTIVNGKQEPVTFVFNQEYTTPTPTLSPTPEHTATPNPTEVALSEQEYFLNQYETVEIKFPESLTSTGQLGTIRISEALADMGDVSVWQYPEQMTDFLLISPILPHANRMAFAENDPRFRAIVDAYNNEPGWFDHIYGNITAPMNLAYIMQAGTPVDVKLSDKEGNMLDGRIHRVNIVLTTIDEYNKLLGIVEQDSTKYTKGNVNYQGRGITMERYGLHQIEGNTLNITVAGNLSGPIAYSEGYPVITWEFIGILPPSTIESRLSGFQSLLKIASQLSALSYTQKEVQAWYPHFTSTADIYYHPNVYCWWDFCTTLKFESEK